MRNILFVCSANKDRSKTADDFFSEKFPQLNFNSAGTNFKICQQLGTQSLTLELLEWADLVIAMEEKHRKFINNSFASSYHHKITVLNIPDKYTYYQKELIDLLMQKSGSLIKENI